MALITRHPLFLVPFISPSSSTPQHRKNQWTQPCERERGRWRAATVTARGARWCDGGARVEVTVPPKPLHPETLTPVPWAVRKRRREEKEAGDDGIRGRPAVRRRRTGRSPLGRNPNPYSPTSLVSERVRTQRTQRWWQQGQPAIRAQPGPTTMIGSERKRVANCSSQRWQHQSTRGRKILSHRTLART